MPTRSGKLAPAIVLLLGVWAGFQNSPASFLGVTKQRAISSSKVACRFFKVPAPDVTESDTIKVTAPARKASSPTTQKKPSDGSRLAPDVTESDTIEVTAPARKASSPTTQKKPSDASRLVSPGIKKSPSPRKDYPSLTKKPASRFTADELAALLGRALAQPVSKDDFIFKNQKFVQIHRATLTLPMLENLEFQGAAHSSDGAQETAMLLAACHVIQKVMPFGGDNDHPKSKLSNLVSYAVRHPISKGDIVYTTQTIGNMIESTVTIPTLKETELTEFKAKAMKKADAEKESALVAIRELEASLTAAGDARIADMITSDSSSRSPKSRLRHLVLHAFGTATTNSDIIYTHRQLGDTFEGAVALPVLKDVEPTEFKATAATALDAEHAAALVAFQELELTLMAQARTRMAS